MTLTLDDPVVAAIRRHDRERFAATLFAPQAHRPALWALLAFNLEIARIRERVTQPIAGQIRLQWWRDALDEAYGRKRVRDHAVARKLAEAISDRPIRRERLDALIDGRERDLDDRPPATLADLEAYAEATASRLIEAQLDVLGVTDPAAFDAARHAGIACALVGLLRAVPFHAAARRIYIPEAILEASALGPDEVFRMRPSPNLADAARRLASAAEDQLARARAVPIPTQALPAFLPTSAAAHHLRVLAKSGFALFAAAVARPDPWTALRYWRAMRRGRI